MKTTYPIYEKNQTKKVYDLLSDKNKEAIKRFLEECSVTSKSVKRTQNRKRALTKLFDFLEKDYDEITYKDYVEISKAISNSKLGVYPRNDDRDFIKRFLRDNYDDWRTKFKDFKLLKAEQKSEEEKISSKDLPTDLEIEKMIAVTDDMKIKTMISLFDECAGRSEEILKTRYNNIDFNNEIISLFSIKTKKKRDIPLNNSISHLKRLKKETNSNDDDFIFSSKNKNVPLTNSGVNHILKKVSKKAGIKKNIYPLIFRHRKLSFLITRLSPKVYEEVSGHSLAIGMKTYAHLSQDKIISEMKERVYEIEELSEKDKHELEKDIEDLKKQVELIKLGSPVEIINKLETEGREDLIEGYISMRKLIDEKFRNVTPHKDLNLKQKKEVETYMFK